MEFSERIKTLQPSAIREIFKVLQNPDIISFAGGNPAPESFPIDAIRRISARLLQTQPVAALQYSVTEGYPPLREQVAARLKTKFNIGAKDDTVLIVTGGQQAIELTCKILCNEGDTVLCEEPSFIGALNAFRSYNTRLKGIPMQPDGMDPDALEQALRTEKNVKLIYTIATFQNPTGITTSLEKRKQIYDLARRYDVAILEDNPYGELRFAGADVPTIKSLDTDGRVIYAGSFSKILSPGMRIGFVCAPAAAAAKIVVAKQISDVHTNIFFQMLTSEYLATEDVDAHIDSIRALYRKKCAAMLQKADATFPEGVTLTRPQGGLFLWCDLGHGVDADEFAKQTLADKVAVVPGSAFMTDERAKTSCVRLNYSMPSLEQIDRGVEVLANAIKRRLKK